MPNFNHSCTSTWIRHCVTLNANLCEKGAGENFFIHLLLMDVSNASDKTMDSLATWSNLIRLILCCLFYIYNNIIFYSYWESGNIYYDIMVGCTVSHMFRLISIEENICNSRLNYEAFGDLWAWLFYCRCFNTQITPSVFRLY